MGFKCGIVGLPNVGKSTLFNALTSTISAEARNYPFCTIEPNKGIVAIPDHRLETLAKIAGSAKIIPTQMEIIDIAGLVKGAHKGEGLGNQFLSHIREVDAVIHLLRCFEDSDIIHVEGEVDPLRDLEIIRLEMILADFESLTKRLANYEKKSKNDKDFKENAEFMKKILAVLDSGKMAKEALSSADDRAKLQSLELLTSKPELFVSNVSESDTVKGNQFTKKVEEFAGLSGVKNMIISGKIESEISMIEDHEEKQEFLEALGLSETGLNKLIRLGYELLNLSTFFTIGPKEAHAWTIEKNAPAPKAAGKIHTDFEKGFIRAEVISCQDYISYKGENGAKDAGKMRVEGKEYLVQDGDIIHFRFNV